MFCVLVGTECSAVHITHNVEYESNKKVGAITGMRIDPFWKNFSVCHRDYSDRDCEVKYHFMTRINDVVSIEKYLEE